MSELLPKFPSRAGYKLYHLLHRISSNEIVNLEVVKSIVPFPIEINNKKCLDIGAAHGGFTSCLLNAGAQKVYSVDVAYGIFDWTLRNDPRVVVLERTNARNISHELIADTIDIVTSDLSFISSSKVALPVKSVMADEGIWLMLCKPQFEIKRHFLTSLNSTQIKKGVIIDPQVIKQVILECIHDLHRVGFAGLPLDVSQVIGRDGNKEYWMILWNSEMYDIDLVYQLADNLLVDFK